MAYGVPLAVVSLTVAEDGVVDIGVLLPKCAGLELEVVGNVYASLDNTLLKVYFIHVLLEVYEDVTDLNFGLEDLGDVVDKGDSLRVLDDESVDSLHLEKRLALLFSAWAASFCRRFELGNGSWSDPNPFSLPIFCS